MKKRSTISPSHGLAAISATALLAAVSGRAQISDNIYLGADGGVGLAQDTSIRNNTGFGGSSIKYDTGWRADGFVGYKVCRYFSAQLDSGVIWNDIDKVGNQTLSGVASGHLEQVPLVAEANFTYPLGRFTPYLMAGAGAAFGIFDSTGVPGSGPGADPNYHSSDTTLAYEGGIGFTYSLTKHLDLGAAYKFFGTTDHDWNANGIALKTDGTVEHTLEATLSWRF